MTGSTATCPAMPQGDIRAKKFDIVQTGHGRGQHIIASVKKESRFANKTALLM